MEFTIPTNPVEGEFFDEQWKVTWRYRVRPTSPAAVFELCHELGIKQAVSGTVEDVRLAIRVAKECAPVLLEAKAADGSEVVIDGKPATEADLIPFIEVHTALGIAIGQTSYNEGVKLAPRVDDERGN